MKRTALLAFPVLAACAVCLWYYDNAGSLTGWNRLLAFGRLAGILGALGVMLQLLLMSRAPWLEPLKGPGLPAWHHRLGLLLPLLLLAHPPLVVLYHAGQNGVPFGAQYLTVLGWEDVPPAAAGLLLIAASALLSVETLRRRLGYGLWRKLHLAVYAGLALAIGHQFEQGRDLSAGAGPWFARAWYGLLLFTGLNSAWYRLVWPRLSRQS